MLEQIKIKDLALVALFALLAYVGAYELGVFDSFFDAKIYVK